MGIFTKIFSGNSEKKDFTEISSYNLGGLSSIFSKKTDPQLMNQEEVLSLYKGVIFGACDAIGDGMAGLKVGLFKDESITEEVKNDSIKLITPSLVKAISIFLKTTGVVYLHKEMLGKKVFGLTILRAWGVTRVVVDGQLKYYTYFDGNGFYRFEKEEIIVLKSFSPLFLNVGMTPLRAVATQVATDFASIEFNKLFFENGGKPGVILKHAAKIDENVRSKYLEEFKRNYTGLHNQHKAAFMDQGIEIETLQSNQRDMQMNEQRQFTIDEVLMVFRVPKPILGKSDGVGFADRGVPGYYFNEFCLKPLARQIEETLNDQLFNGLGVFSFVFMQDKDELLKEYMGNTISLNQYLIATGRKPVVGGDRLWDGTEVQVIDTKKDIGETNLKGLSFGIENVLKKVQNQTQFGSEEYNQKVWETKISRTDKYEEELAKLQKRIWKFQEDEIIENLTNKKGMKKIEKEEELFDEKKSKLLYISLLTKFFRDIMSKEGQVSIEEVSAEMFAIAKLNKWIGENIDRMSDDINQVTRQEIFEIVKQGNRDKVGVAQILSSVRAKFAEYTRKSGRIEKIVRTEITRSSNKSQEEAYIQSGVVVQKEWYTAIDERRCQYCADMHGKKIKLGESFLKLGETHLGQKIDYETINFPPRHVQCRCTERPIISRRRSLDVEQYLSTKNISLSSKSLENE